MLNFNLNLVFTIINLLILYFLVKRFLFKPVQDIIAKRQEEVEAEFKKAEEAEKIADEIKVKYETSLAGVDDKKKEIVAEARQRANEEYDKIVAEANAQADKIVKNAKADAEAEKVKILSKADAEITEMVINATAKVVGAKVDVANDRALYDQFLGKAGE